MHVLRNLREMDLNGLIISSALASRVITRVFNSPIIRLFLHEARHIEIFPLVIELKDRAVDITSSLPSQANINVGALFRKVNDLILSHIESPGLPVPILCFLEHDRVESSHVQIAPDHVLALGEILSRARC